jgi:hypothetical protein
MSTERETVTIAHLNIVRGIWLWEKEATLLLAFSRNGEGIHAWIVGQPLA